MPLESDAVVRDSVNTLRLGVGPYTVFFVFSQRGICTKELRSGGVKCSFRQPPLRPLNFFRAPRSLQLPEMANTTNSRGQLTRLAAFALRSVGFPFVPRHRWLAPKAWAAGMFEVGMLREGSTPYRRRKSLSSSVANLEAEHAEQQRPSRIRMCRSASVVQEKNLSSKQLGYAGVMCLHRWHTSYKS
ncbi:hypothetical protein BDY17DRAFT_14069 [Neohortaea acidophila]|uniref:Uncharacterized protein n=1 Tax=Neohortaea acidophila TaxID=245834 RepID=A0A6A6Q6H7_9PEZI|nr:uncharacterized protein BDY17DRAFT_14069 [Neohortaea acidophila]KAF2487576.1 hypothetical protein BDY17DRAFT_14069 [Neohortaea acidophila]